MMTNEELADRLFQRVEAMVAKAIGPVVERLESLEAVTVPTASDVAKTILGGDEVATLVDLYVNEAVGQLEPIKGDPGKNADPKEVAAELARCGVLDQLTAEAVSKHFEANPVRDGKDVTPQEVAKAVSSYLKENPIKEGMDATPEMVAKAVFAYLKDNPPEKGRDGLDLKDLFRAEGGRLVAVLSDGTTKDLGQFVGRDGRSIENLTRTYSSESHEVVEKWVTPDGEKELRYPAGGIRPGGYWREGTKSVAAQVWNHAGVAWIAKRDTSDKPTRESPDWEVFANKGRDGDDAKVAKPKEPVKLHG